MINLTAQIVTEIDELAKLDFSIGADAGAPFLSKGWLVPWCKHFLGPGDTLHTIVLRDGGNVVAIAPLCIQLLRGKGRVMQFLGTGAACSDYLTVLCKEQYEEAATRVLACELEAAKDDWDRIELDGVLKSDPRVRRLSELLEESYCSVHQVAIESCWRLALPKSLDEYLANSSKNHRKKSRRMLKRFETGEVTVNEASDQASFETGYAALKDLHSRRWQSLGQPGCFASPDFDNFLRAASWELLCEDRLSLVWIQAGDQTIGADLAIKTGSGFYAYQSGISPEHLDNNPGRLLNLWQIKRAIESGCEYIDFLRGDEEYKAQWQAEPAACVRYEIVPPKLRSRAVQAAISARRNVRSLFGSSST